MLMNTDIVGSNYTFRLLPKRLTSAINLLKTLWNRRRKLSFTPPSKKISTKNKNYTERKLHPLMNQQIPPSVSSLFTCEPVRCRNHSIHVSRTNVLRNPREEELRIDPSCLHQAEAFISRTLLQQSHYISAVIPIMCTPYIACCCCNRKTSPDDGKKQSPVGKIPFSLAGKVALFQTVPLHQCDDLDCSLRACDVPSDGPYGVANSGDAGGARYFS